MSEYLDAEIEEATDRLLDAQIADYEEERARHRYSVDRKLWIDKKGFHHMSDYWQIRCSCRWRGTRITRPGRAQSKQRVDEWREHVRDTVV